jgi:hypothetical protein
LSSEATRLIVSSDLTSEIRCNSDFAHWPLGMPPTVTARAQRSNTTNLRLVEDSATGGRSFLHVVGHSPRRDVSLRRAPRYGTYRCHRLRGLRARARCTTSGRKPAAARSKDGGWNEEAVRGSRGCPSSCTGAVRCLSVVSRWVNPFAPLAGRHPKTLVFVGVEWWALVDSNH